MQLQDDISVTLKPYRSQWGHWPMAFLPFLAAVAATALLVLLEPVIGEAVASAVLGMVGIGFAVSVFLLPWLLRTRGMIGLRVRSGEIALVVPKDGQVIATCPANAVHIIPAEFHFSVSGRLVSGTYRAPAFLMQFDDRAPLAVGTTGCSLSWGHAKEHIKRPDYLLSAEEWQKFVEMIGLANQLVTVVDARVH
jgi:hypothetical protein